MSVTVVIGTFGDRERWTALARRAIASVERQTRLPDDVLHVHAASLQEARNLGAAEARTEWLCFLDADDELDPGYVAAMLAGEGDLRCPRLQEVVDGHALLPRALGPFELTEQNYLVIGTLVRRAQFLRVGGFHDWPIYEDWDLWLRCREDGASIVLCPDAIYRAHLRADGRNRQAGELRRAVYQAIRRAARARSAGAAAVAQVGVASNPSLSSGRRPPAEP